MEFNNSLQIVMSLKKDRALSLSLDNNLLTESQGMDYSIGIGYRIKDLQINNLGGRNRTSKGDLNIKTDKDDNKYSGSIISIEDDLIKIKLDSTINFLNKQTSTLTYNKTNDYNYFYIYPSTEQNNIYYKNPLNEEIIAFIFPEDDNNIQKNIKFISPNISELISYYDDFLNQEDINKILIQYNFDRIEVDYFYHKSNLSFHQTYFYKVKDNYLLNFFLY